MGMIQCSNCGSLLPDQSRFCGRCGQLVPVFAEKDLDAPTIASSSGTSFVTFISEDNLKTVRVQPISSPHAATTQNSGPHTPIEDVNFDVSQYLATEAVGRLPTAPLPSVGNEPDNEEDGGKRKIYPVVGMAGGIAGLNALPNQMQVPMAQTPSLGSAPYVQGTPDLGGVVGGPVAPRIEGAMPYQGFSSPPQTPGGAPAVQDMHGAHQLTQRAYPQQSSPAQSYSQQYNKQVRQQQSIYGETSQGLNFLKGLLPVGGSLVLIILIIVSVMVFVPTFASGPRLIITGGKAAPGAIISVRGEKFIPRGIVSFTVNGVPVASNGAMRLQVSVAGLSAPLVSDGGASDDAHLANLSTVVGSDGTFEADIPLPAQAPANGRYIIEASEQSGEQTAKASLEITVEQVPTPTPTPSLIPTEEPTATPTPAPTATPVPTKEPTVVPTPTPVPTKEPTVTPPPPSCVNVAPAELVFSQQEGSTGPQSQKFAVTNCGQTGVITLSKDANWLNISATSLNLNAGAKGEITVTASGNGLPIGSHSAQITVKSGTATKTVKVVLTITAVAKCSLIVDKGPLTYTMDQGGTNPGAQSIQIAGQNCNSGETASVTVKTDTGGNWLRVDKTSVPLNAGNQSVSVSIDGGGRNAGKYTGRVIVAQGTTTQVVEVVLTVRSVEPKECLNVTPDVVRLEATSGQEQPAGVDLTIENCGSATALVKEAVTQGAEWLSTDSTSVEISAKSTGKVIIRASALKLAPGTYTGEAQFTVGALIRTVKVTFVVAEAPVTLVCSLSVSKDALSFTMEAGAPDPTPQSVVVSGTNCGQATVSIIAQDPTWLSASPETIAVTPKGTTLTVTVDGQGFFDPVQLTGQVLVKVGAVEKTIQVTLAITPPSAPCTVQVDPTFIDISSVSGDPPLAAKVSVILTNCGETPVTVLAETADGGTWLQARLEGNVLIITLDSAGLEPAPYAGAVTVTAGSASAKVTVDFLVTASSSPG